MCDPITASIALTVAGTAAQSAGQNRARKAMEGAQEAERIRQRGFQQQSEAVQQASEARGSKSNQDKEQAAAEASRQADYAAATAAAQAPVVAAGENIAGDQAANAIIANEAANASRNALAFAGQQGNAKAALQGFSDLQLGNALANARAMEQQRTLGNFMQGSSGVLGLEMEAASRKGDNLKTLGTLLNAGGMITGMGAGAGWFGTNPSTAATLETASKGLAPSLTIGEILKNGVKTIKGGKPVLGGTPDPSLGMKTYKLNG